MAIREQILETNSEIKCPCEPTSVNPRNQTKQIDGKMAEIVAKWLISVFYLLKASIIKI